jgi:hypothetical protein
MLGYDKEDIAIMQECIEKAKQLYLSYPSDLMDKTRVTTGLEQANSFFDGLWAEGYFD